MAQHDYVIANASGATVRGDLNDALAATVSQNSGATEPATRYAYMLWADTTSGLLKIRDAANAAWIVVGTLAATYLGLGSSLPGHLFGLGLSNGADTANDIDVAIGQATSDDAAVADRVLMTLASGLTKRLDAAWAVGTNQGGLDTGAIANTTYHVFLIQRTDTGVVDALFSASPTSPTMPANYTKKRRIGSILRAAGAIRQFVQIGNEFLHKTTPLSDVQSLPPASTNAITAVLSVPSGISVIAIVNATLGGHTTGTALLLSALSQTDIVASTYFSQVLQPSAGAGAHYASGQVRVRTDTAASIRTRVSATDGTTLLYIGTHGWIDTRGQES